MMRKHMVTLTIGMGSPSCSFAQGQPAPATILVIDADYRRTCEHTGAMK
jgi:hypothetical protein